MFAPDDAYINPSERDPDYQEMEWSYSLAMSHAVVDSIAAELADALRSLIGDPIPDGVAGIHYRQHGALQRFDNLTKGTE